MARRWNRKGWLSLAAGVGVTVCLGALLGWLDGKAGGAAPASAPAARARPPTIVTTTPAREMEFRETLSADGSLKSRFYSLVAPRISGIIDDIFVREGNPVRQHQTRLFQVDNEKLRQSVDHARQTLVIARSTLEERKAGLIKAEADVRQAEKDYVRYKSLYEQKVVPLSEYEVYETAVVQLEAQRLVARTAVTLAEQNVTLAEISLAMAETDFRDSVVLSPIDGVVSERHAEPGEMGSSGKTILRIDDVDRLKAVAYLPGQFYPRIEPGVSIARVAVRDRHLGDFPVTYKAPAIDSALRTFEIWADLPGDGAYAVPGAQCVIDVVLRAARGVGVPRDAVQIRDSRNWIFVPDGDAARMVEVTTGLATDGWVELIDPPIQAGDPVVTQGQFLLEDGAPIRERDR